MESTRYSEIIEKVIQEVSNQNVTWGIQRHSPETWITIILEEVGEAASVLQKDDTNMEKELIQVAASCINALYAMDMDFDEDE